MRVLVVDDSPTIRRVVTAILERHGHDATAAADGLSALDMLGAKGLQVDLVLLDFVMPRMNGFQFCRALRQRPEHAATPVVLMSAKSDKIRDQFVQQTGAIDAITKPFDAQALVAVIEHAMKRLRSGRVVPSSTALPDFPDDGDLAPASRAASEVPARAVLHGDVAYVPVGAVLQMLQVEQRSGLLVVSNDDCEVRIALHEGLIDFVESRNTAEEFRLGRFFVERGFVTRAELEEVLAQQAAATARVARASDVPTSSAPPPKANGDGASLLDLVDKLTDDPPPSFPMTVPLLGDALVQAGRIGDGELRSALERQSSELVYEVLRWTKGRFELRRDPGLVSTSKLRLPVAHVVMEGFRRVDEWRLIESRIESFEAVLVRDSMAIDSLGVGALPREEQDVLDLVNGQRTVRDLVAESNMSSFDACKVLYQLLEARLVRRRP